MQKHGKEWMDGGEREKKRGKENKGGGRKMERQTQRKKHNDRLCLFYLRLGILVN